MLVLSNIHLNDDKHIMHKLAYIHIYIVIYLFIVYMYIIVY